MGIRFKHFRGRALKEFRDRDEIIEDICARTFTVHRECIVNDYITVRLEEVEHLYEEYTWEYQKHPEKFYDYEWVIRIYVEGVDEFTDDKYTIHEYNDFIRSIKFLPLKRGKYGWGWDDTLDNSIKKKFNDICMKFRNWSKNDYDINLLDFKLMFPLLKKLIDAGDKRALIALKEKLINIDDPNIFVWLKTYSLTNYINEQKLNMLFSEKLKENRIVNFRGAKVYMLEVKTLIDFEELIGKNFVLQQGCDYDDSAFNFWVRDNHITEIDIQNVWDLKSIPESIGSLTFLERLNLRWTGITRLPISMRKLKKLKDIDLYSCKIKWPDPLPKDAQDLVEFLQLKEDNKVEFVNFQDKQFEVVNGSLNLNGLGINNIAELQGFQNLKNLKELNLGKNNLKIRDLPSFETLEKLNMRICKLTEMGGIERFNNLTDLNLGFNSIDEIKGIKNLTRLEILNLRHNNIKEIKELENLTNIRELYLSDNDIKELKGLENLENLKKLDISGNEKAPKGIIASFKKLDSYEKVARAFVEYCKMKKQLGIKELSAKDFFRNKGKTDFVTLKSETYFMEHGLQLFLTNKNIKKIEEIEGLDELIQLETLHLSKNQISEISGLERLKNLKGLHLEENKITEIKGLESLLPLKYLHLGNNEITKINGLDHLPKLRNLDLQYNNIEEIEGLDKLTNLRSLTLANNQINEVKGLENLDKLTHVHFKDNPFFKEFEDEIKSRDLWEYERAQTFVIYLKVKAKFKLSDLNIADYFRLISLKENILDVDPKELIKLYEDITEKITVDCELCGNKFKERKDDVHFEKSVHKEAIIKKIEELQKPTDLS